MRMEAKVEPILENVLFYQVLMMQIDGTGLAVSILPILKLSYIKLKLIFSSYIQQENHISQQVS